MEAIFTKIQIFLKLNNAEEAEKLYMIMKQSNEEHVLTQLSLAEINLFYVNMKKHSGFSMN